MCASAGPKQNGWTGGRYLALLLVWLVAGSGPVKAHPVPKGSHDRTLTVRLTREALIVEYRLEADFWTIIYQDLPLVKDQEELSKLTEPAEFFGAFTSLFAPRLATRLRATLDGRPLTLASERARYEVPEDRVVRFDFVFRASWQPSSAVSHRFVFRDTNFQGRPGQVKVALATAAGVQLRPASPRPGMTQEEARSGVWTDFTLVDPSQAPASEPEQEGGAASRRQSGEDSGLLRLFFDSHRAFWLLLVLSVGLGAVHALTPGHGKTLVAAYLVGERGTIRHAVVLGLVTTLTHTGVVLALAAVLWLKFPDGISDAQRSGIQRALGLGGGILVAGLGFWLLLRRLSGKADHVHLGGSGHHHYHHHDHHHHDHTHSHSHPAPGGWWGLIALGIQGGIVPCWDAVALLVAAVAMNMLWLALPMLLAFSAGLAGVLVAVGILVVRSKALAGKRWEDSRFFRALPVVSALLVSGLGLWLCSRALKGG